MRYSYTLSLTSVVDRGWVVNVMPWPLYLLEKRPGTSCAGDWVCPTVDLDCRSKSLPNRVTILVTSSPWRVAIPIELSRPTVLLGFDVKLQYMVLYFGSLPKNLHGMALGRTGNLTLQRNNFLKLKNITICLYVSPNITTVITSRKTCWAGNVVR